MKKRILPLLAPTLLLLSALLAGCNKDETDANRLPNGKHPLTLTATVEGLTATRATTNNTWTGGEEVAVIIDNASVQKYTAAKDGALAAPSNATPYYWQSTDERKDVLAWVPYSDTKPTEFEVKADQRGDGYAQSDMLWSSQQISYHNSTLTFKHLPAKVVVNLKSGGEVTAVDLEKATVTLVNQNLTSGKIADNWKVETAALGSAIIPYNVHPATTDFQKIVQALVVPQQMKGKKFIKVEITTGTAAGNYYYTPTGNADANLESGKQHTYNITVQKTGLEVTAEISNWEGGTGGSGTSGTWYPVYTPPTNGDAFYTLSDGDKIMIAGSGTKTSGRIVIELPGAKTSVTVVLSNVNIEANGGGIIIRGGGTATILLNGTQNRLSSLSHGGCGLRIADKDTHVKINGPGTLTAVGTDVGAAIGSYGNSPCGDITIKDAVINATADGAAIGAGFPDPSSSCGNITIINSDITASVTAHEGFPTGAAIGAGPYDSFHGDISITLKEGQTKDDFLNKLTVGSGADKVGKGAGNTSSSSFGAITWYNSDETKLKTD